MKQRIIHLLGIALIASIGIAHATTRIVTTTASTGVGSLNAAITALAAGDTITFNIPGTGPFYITPPVGGFPIITVDNVTIDGYTQPGASVNTSTILGANNANIQIVIRGSDDGTDANRHFTDLTAANMSGFTDGEEALLAFNGASGCTVRGLCFEGNWVDSEDLDPPDNLAFESEYAIALGGDGTSANCHISGCRFGLDPDGVTVGRLKDGIASFSGGVNNLSVGVAAGPADAAAARAQFNVFIGMYISVIVEQGPVRISGNFFNVYPDGLHDYNVNTDDGSLDHSMEAMMEFKSLLTDLVIGTDGDGLNDAEERNVFGGATLAGDNRILEWWGTGPSGLVVAGNYFGVGIDGLTRFTNGGPNMELAETLKQPARTQFGSDFNGVSDAIEANVISWNYPFATLYPDPLNPGLSGSWRFANIDINPLAIVSLRGNKMIGMDPAPFTYVGRTNDAAGRLTSYSNYVANFMVPTGDFNTFYPHLSASSTSTHLIGTCAPGNPPYDTAIIIDLYKADPEGWVNGMKFGFTNLVVGGVTNGFPQGKTYVGSLKDNGPFDSDPAVGSFNFNIGPGGANLGLSSSDFVTVTANYSDTAPGPAGGATGANVHTSNFSHPVALGPILIGSASVGGGGTTLTINWTGGVPPFTLQKKSTINGAWSPVQTGLLGPPATDTMSGPEGYYRVVGN